MSNILEILLFEILFRLMLYGCGGRHCNKKYEGIKYNVVDMMKIFCDNLVHHTIKGEYDSIKGTEEKMHKKRQKIRKIWWPILLWLDELHEYCWNYTPPRWLFHPPNTLLFQT